MRMYFAYMNYADPHPGNFLFLDDGRLGLLDFGCVQRYTEEEREILAVSQQAIAGDEAAFLRLIDIACHVRPGDPDSEAYLKLLRQSFDWMMEPMRTSGPFDFGDGGHLERGYAWFSEMVHRRKLRGHPTYVYFNRSVFGVKALLYRLRARVDLRSLHEQERKRWGGGPQRI
jgi:predicted unusual protein kinase regulating ubiquinone biosynthesis (AarF/ABC1/UbiB family)